MKISEYVKDYTSGRRVTLWRVGGELAELFQALLYFDSAGAEEEFQDVIHFVQLWCFWRFGLTGEIWKASRDSVKKFMERRAVWKRIYAHAGLPEDISNFVGNYKKLDKVIVQLGKFGINAEKARQVYVDLRLGSSK